MNNPIIINPVQSLGSLSPYDRKAHSITVNDLIRYLNKFDGDREVLIQCDMKHPEYNFIVDGFFPITCKNFYETDDIYEWEDEEE